MDYLDKYVKYYDALSSIYSTVQQTVQAEGTKLVEMSSYVTKFKLSFEELINYCCYLYNICYKATEIYNRRTSIFRD